jgi:hypothetical protein
MRRCAAIVAVVAASATPLRASAGPVDVLRDAEGWFVYGDFAGVIDRLAPLVDPDEPARRSAGSRPELRAARSVLLLFAA